jgi:hypothetical protein
VERKTLLLDLLRQARETEMDFVDGLSDGQRARSGTLEDWSAKDVIAHVAAWKARMADILRVADLRWADLRGANLSRADLSWATLIIARVTDEQLAQAKSLKGATMPDGTKHD